MKKIAVVTGSSSGIGEFCAKFLLEESYIVYGASRLESSISHPDFIDLELNVASEKSVEQFYNEIEKDTEVIDLFIHCAGVSDQSSLEETSSAAFIQNMTVNSMGSFLIFKGLESFLIEDETQIINFLPISTLKSYEYTVAYSASSAAKKSLLDIIKLEWQKYKLSFTDIYLSATDTAMWDEYEDLDREKMIGVEDLTSTIKYLIDKPQSLNIDQIILKNKESLI